MGRGRLLVGGRTPDRVESIPIAEPDSGYRKKESDFLRILDPVADHLRGRAVDGLAYFSRPAVLATDRILLAAQDAAIAKLNPRMLDRVFKVAKHSLFQKLSPLDGRGDRE